MPARSMTIWFCVLLAAPFAAGQSDRVDVAGLGPTDLAPYVEELEKRGAAPVDYLVRKCKKYGVVMVGEVHAVRENCRFMADAIGPLYHKAGVRQLATEFLRSKNTGRVNTLVTAAKWDGAQAADIQRDGPWPTWGYQEYLDILKAVWQLNRALPADAERFRIAGLDSDWTQHQLWFEVKDRRKQFDIRMAREKNMVKVMEEAAFAPGRKTIVHVGYSHSILCHGLRLGTVLYKKYPDRMFQVALHQSVSAGRRKMSKLTKFLEAVLAAREGRPVGIDVLGSRFGNLYDDRAMWARARRDYRFSDMAQGYVFLAPLDRLHRVTWVKGFITPDTFKQARAVAERVGYVKRGTCPDAKTLDSKLAEWFDGRIAEKKL